MPWRFILSVAWLSIASIAVAEPIESRAPRLWFSQSECWASVSAALNLLIDDFGLSEIIENSPDRIETEIIDAVSGRGVMRIGCVRVPTKSDRPRVFRRYFKMP